MVDNSYLTAKDERWDAQSFITDKEKIFTKLQRAKQREQTSSPKIQRVAHYLRERKDFSEHYYSPKLVSFGPIHHGSPKLWLGEEYKLMWASMYIESTRYTPQALYEKIACNIKELKDLFTKDVMDPFTMNRFLNDERVTLMLFVDGCSLLHILKKASLGERAMNVKADQLALAMQDVLLLENQLPYKVLKLLWIRGDAFLIEMMINFFSCYSSFPVNMLKHLSSDVIKFILLYESPPTHLLDLLRRMILHPKERERDLLSRMILHPEEREGDEKNHRVNIEEVQLGIIQPRNIEELKTAGIKIIPSNFSGLRDVSFEPRTATLKLPFMNVNETTTPLFLNLIALEMCPEFQNDYGISSYVAFLDSLIDHPGDVKELRSAKVLLNFLGSDEEVAGAFNILGQNLVINPEAYNDVRTQIDQHFSKPWRVFYLSIIQNYRTYFSTPWSITGFVAALIALGLSLIQTLYAIIGSKC